MKAIFNREFKSYFTSMIGPVFVAALVLVTGIYFMVYNMSYGYPYFAYTLSASAIVFVLTVPLLTMRSFSEERHSKTDQLLLTSPVSVTQIVLGKFFSMAAVVAIPCVIFCLCPLIIKSTGTAYFLVDYSTILVYFLIGCAYVAIGMLISAMTGCHHRADGTIITLLLINLSNGLSTYVPNTAIASLIGCLILLVLLCVIVYVMTKSNAATFGLLIGGAAVLIILYVVKPALFEGLVPGMIENIAFAKVMTSFVSDYVFDVKGVVELISICAACIFLTTQVIQKRRWS
ncbi:MAG: ABC transporter permease [Lachnospiraceae bacterium]